MSRGRRDYARDEADMIAAYRLAQGAPEALHASELARRFGLRPSIARRLYVVRDAPLEPLRLWLDTRELTSARLVSTVLYYDEEADQLGELAEKK